MSFGPDSKHPLTMIYLAYSRLAHNRSTEKPLNEAQKPSYLSIGGKKRPPLFWSQVSVEYSFFLLPPKLIGVQQVLIS